MLWRSIRVVEHTARHIREGGKIDYPHIQRVNAAKQRIPHMQRLAKILYANMEANGYYQLDEVINWPAFGALTLNEE